MRVETINGLLTLYYDGTDLYNENLEREWNECDALEISNVSAACKEYWNERLSWRQVIVMEGVTELPNCCFRCCYRIETLILANTVVRIGNSAANHCRKLKKIKWSINLRSMGNYAFTDCDLRSVFIPPRCINIGRSAFAHNYGLNIFHVDRHVQIDNNALLFTKIFQRSPFYVPIHRLDDFDGNRLNNWMKNLNERPMYSLHRVCASFYPREALVFLLVQQMGIRAFNIKNEIGITPSKYLQENPYVQIKEMSVIRQNILWLMGEQEE